MTFNVIDEPESSAGENSFFLLRPDDTVDATDVVDMAVLAGLEGAQIDGEPDIVVELMKLYLEDAAGKLTSMQGNAVGKDGVTLARLAHNLRGSSANLGARRVAALCAGLERVGEDAPSSVVEELLAKLELELERVRSVFEAECRRRS